eukprot:7346488-Pyramimonas_sp.AAC.1
MSTPAWPAAAAIPHVVCSAKTSAGMSSRWPLGFTIRTPTSGNLICCTRSSHETSTAHRALPPCWGPRGPLPTPPSSARPPKPEGVGAAALKLLSSRGRWNGRRFHERPRHWGEGGR